MKPYFLAACCAISLAASGVQADTYVGGFYGISDSGESGLDSDKAMRLGVGFEVSDTLSFEANYVNLGSYDVTDQEVLDVMGYAIESALQGQFPGAEVDVNSMTMPSTGFELSLLGEYPLTDKVNVFGRLGLFKWEMEMEGQFVVTMGSQSESLAEKVKLDDGLDTVVGVGASYQINPALSINAEFSNYAMGDFDSRVMGLGLRWHF